MRPQPYTAPSMVTAKLCWQKAATARIPESSDITRGVVTTREATGHATCQSRGQCQSMICGGRLQLWKPTGWRETDAAQADTETRVGGHFVPTYMTLTGHCNGRVSSEAWAFAAVVSSCRQWRRSSCICSTGVHQALQPWVLTWQLLVFRELQPEHRERLEFNPNPNGTYAHPAEPNHHPR